MHARPLIVRLRNWVGDVVLGVPALQRLQAAGYELRLTGKGWARDLLAGHGWPIEPLAGTASERVAQLRRLRAQARAQDGAFDARLNAICFPYSFGSALEFRLAGLRAIGHRHEARSWLLANALPRDAAAHEMAGYWQAADALLGEREPLPERIVLELAPAHRAEAARVRQQLGLAEGYLMLCPFAGGTFEKLDKSWPGFPALAGHLAGQFAAQGSPPSGRALLICPGPGEEETIAARDYPGCRIARGVGLGAYAALLQQSALVIANDTGPGHMAAAVGAPLLSVLGPTEPARWGAIGPTVHILRESAGWPGVEVVAAHARRLLAA